MQIAEDLRVVHVSLAMKGITLPKLVLIADDDDDSRSLVAGAVSALGFSTITAANGEQAISFCQETEPDLAILDMMMPGKSGREVCDYIKSSKGGQLIPVLILTARDNVQDKVDALSEGADDYLTKPFHFQELQARVQALLRVRELNLSLQEKNRELQAMQQKLVEKERQAVVHQLAGTAAHQLGQPLAAIMLNLHLLEVLPVEDARYKTALTAINDDVRRLVGMLERLKSADASKKAAYYEGLDSIEVDEK